MPELALYCALSALVALLVEHTIRAINRALSLRESLLQTAIAKAHDAQTTAEQAATTARTAESIVLELQRQLSQVQLKLGLTQQNRGH